MGALGSHPMKAKQRPPGGKTLIGGYLPRPLADKIREAATSANLTVTQFVRVAVERALANPPRITQEGR